jgi:predicted NACHT family NTPase
LLGDIVEHLGEVLFVFFIILSDCLTESLETVTFAVIIEIFKSIDVFSLIFFVIQLRQSIYFDHNIFGDEKCNFFF